MNARWACSACGSSEHVMAPFWVDCNTDKVGQTVDENRFWCGSCGADINRLFDLLDAEDVAKRHKLVDGGK